MYGDTTPKRTSRPSAGRGAPVSGNLQALGERVKLRSIAHGDTCARLRGKIADDVSLYHAQRQIVEDRAVRPVVAVAFLHELAQRLRHRLHLRDARLEIAHVRLGDAPH